MIYSLIEEVEAAVSGMLEPIDVDVVDAHAEVLQVFPIRRIGNIAGARCDDGTITPDLALRLFRAGDEVASGKIRSLRRFQDEAREVLAGQEFRRRPGRALTTSWPAIAWSSSTRSARAGSCAAAAWKPPPVSDPPPPQQRI